MKSIIETHYRTYENEQTCQSIFALTLSFPLISLQKCIRSKKLAHFGNIARKYCSR